MESFQNSIVEFSLGWLAVKEPSKCTVGRPKWSDFNLEKTSSEYPGFCSCPPEEREVEASGTAGKVAAAVKSFIGRKH